MLDCQMVTYGYAAMGFTTSWLYVLVHNPGFLDSLELLSVAEGCSSLLGVFLNVLTDRAPMSAPFNCRSGTCYTLERKQPQGI